MMATCLVWFGLVGVGSWRQCYPRFLDLNRFECRRQAPIGHPIFAWAPLNSFSEPKETQRAVVRFSQFTRQRANVSWNLVYFRADENDSQSVWFVVTHRVHDR